MKLFQKLTAAALALVLAAGTAACSGSDKTWAAKNDALTVPIGAYIYYEYLAYQNASSQVADASKPVLEQTVEDKNAEEWIREKALDYTKLLFVADAKMKEMDLALTGDEETQAKSDASSQWTQYGSTLEGYGISKESFSLATAQFSAKSNRIFDAIYGKNGTNPVSDDDLKSYFEKNYTDFTYLIVPLYNPTTYAALDEKTAADYKKTFDGYAEQLNKGEKTFAEIEDACKKKLSLDSAPTQNVTAALDDASGYPESLKKLIAGMKAGEAKTLDVTDANAYILVVKHDITQKTESQFSSDSGREAVLNKLKSQEFSDLMEEEAKKLTGLTINQKAIDSFKPAMFVTKDTASNG